MNEGKTQGKFPQENLVIHCTFEGKFSHFMYSPQSFYHVFSQENQVIPCIFQGKLGHSMHSPRKLGHSLYFPRKIQSFYHVFSQDNQQVIHCTFKGKLGHSLYFPRKIRSIPCIFQGNSTVKITAYNHIVGCEDQSQFYSSRINENNGCFSTDGLNMA